MCHMQLYILRQICRHTIRLKKSLDTSWQSPTCEVLVELFHGRLRVVPEQRVHGHDDAGRAEAALGAVGAGDPLLHRVEARLRRPDALHRRHRHPVHRRHRGQARVDRVVAVEDEVVRLILCLRFGVYYLHTVIEMALLS